MVVTSEIQINAPKDKVFNVFSDLSNLEKNISGITKVEILGEKTTGEGAKWRETRIMFGKEAIEEMWISDFKPSDSFGVSAESHGVKYYSLYNFDEVDGGTKVTLVFSGEPQTFMAKVMSAISSPFMKGTVKKAFMQDMKELKEIIEQNNS